MKLHCNGFANVLTVLIIVAVIAGFAGYFLVYQAKAPAVITPILTVSPTIPTISTSPSINASSTLNTSAWKTYRNEKYGFELKYPADFNESIHLPVSNDFFFVDFIPISTLSYHATYMLGIWSNQTSLDQFFVRTYFNPNLGWQLINLNGVHAKQADYIDYKDNKAKFPRKYVLITVKNNFGFIFYATQNVKGDADIEMAKQITSTFKFFEPK